MLNVKIKNLLSLRETVSLRNIVNKIFKIELFKKRSNLNQQWVGWKIQNNEYLPKRWYSMCVKLHRKVLNGDTRKSIFYIFLFTNPCIEIENVSRYCFRNMSIKMFKNCICIPFLFFFAYWFRIELHRRKYKLV